MMGWSAATGGLEAGAWVLGGVLYAWQASVPFSLRFDLRVFMDPCAPITLDARARCGCGAFFGGVLALTLRSSRTSTR
jgi:hypothetical protein